MNGSFSSAALDGGLLIADVDLLRPQGLAAGDLEPSARGPCGRVSVPLLRKAVGDSIASPIGVMTLRGGVRAVVMASARPGRDCAKLTSGRG